MQKLRTKTIAYLTLLTFNFQLCISCAPENENIRPSMNSPEKRLSSKLIKAIHDDIKKNIREYNISNNGVKLRSNISFDTSEISINIENNFNVYKNNGILHLLDENQIESKFIGHFRYYYDYYGGFSPLVQSQECKSN